MVRTQTPATPTRQHTVESPHRSDTAWCSDSRVKESDMGLGDKIENMKDDMVGKGKEGAGKVTDDERLEAEGRTDQSKADLKQAGEKAKDAFRS